MEVMYHEVVKDLSSLLERDNDVPLTWQDELVAVRDGQKGLSMQSYAHPAVRADEKNDCSSFVETALEMGLLVTMHLAKSRIVDRRELYVFASKEEQLWRIPAFVSVVLANSENQWCDAAECFMSSILGYNEEQIQTWISKYHRRSIAWSGPTIYLLVTESQSGAILSSGASFFPSSVDLTGVAVLYPLHWQILRRDAYRQLPPGTVLIRLSVKEGMIGRIFENATKTKDYGYYQTTLAREVAETMNQNIRSKIERLTESGWV
jgi:hypothetical protein